MDDTARLRVVFEDRHILSQSQKSEGLNRSWLLLKPQHDTISSLSTYLTHIFDLHRSCPHGIKLSMHGFVLPPFESTCILKDKDVIRVKRKGGILREAVQVGDGANLIEEEEIVEKQPVLTHVPLLANEEFEKETGGYQSEPEDDEDNQETSSYQLESGKDEDNQAEDTLDNSSGGNAISKKRKASKKLESSKNKKKRKVVPEDIENGFQIQHNVSCNNGALHHRKSIDKKDKLFDARIKRKRTSTLKNAEGNNDAAEPLSSSKRFGELQEDATACAHIPLTSEGTRKVPSRSARRKKAKRQWLKELKAEMKELYQAQSSEKDRPKNHIENQENTQNGEAGAGTADVGSVPIVIRPGHIRFEPLGKDAGQAVPQSLVSVETSLWNRITGKKKGQKWCNQKLASSRRNDCKELNKERSEMMTCEKVKLPIGPIDFDMLPPLNRLPQEGDVIAYRLVELSSTWSPKLSTFRMGKTTWCDPKSKRVLLTPVPEHPICFDKQPDEDAWAQQLANSLYKEDGSLEVSFMSLIDVRIVKHDNPYPAKAVTGWVSAAPTPWTVAPSNNNKQAHAPTPENEVNVWDRLIQAQSARKVQVIHVNSGSKQNPKAQ